MVCWAAGEGFCAKGDDADGVDEVLDVGGVAAAGLDAANGDAPKGDFVCAVFWPPKGDAVAGAFAAAGAGVVPLVCFSGSSDLGLGSGAGAGGGVCFFGGWGCGGRGSTFFA